MHATRDEMVCLVTKRINEKDGTVLLGHRERFVFGSSPCGLNLCKDSMHCTQIPCNNIMLQNSVTVVKT